MADITRLTASLADRYRIERALGTGGMATVYLAVEGEGQGKEVAGRTLVSDVISVRSEVQLLERAYS